MAKFETYFPELLKHEGNFVNDKYDAGGATNKGITLATWKRFGYDKNNDGTINAEDVKLITAEDAGKIAKRQYWDFFLADKIVNQSIAAFIVDWGYNSGVVTVALKVQRLINVKADGVFGPVTVGKINNYHQETLFNALVKSRTDFVHAIVANRPTQKRFLKGWLNRINSFKFRY